jgi:hypothetical protein
MNQPKLSNQTKEIIMKKISIALLALAAISTAALANDNRDGRGYQDSLGQFTSPTEGTTLFGPAVSEATIRKHKGMSAIVPNQAVRLFEKNGTTDSGV